VRSSSVVVVDEITHSELVERSVVRSERQQEVNMFLNYAIQEGLDIGDSSQPAQQPQKLSFFQRLMGKKQEDNSERLKKAQAARLYGWLSVTGTPYSTVGSSDSNLTLNRSQVINFEINRSELADGLGLDINSPFIRRIFSDVAPDNLASRNQVIKFHQVLKLVTELADGSPEEKEKMIVRAII
jgi:hypothetical protein